MSMTNTKLNKAIELHQSGMVAEAIAMYLDLLLIDQSSPHLLFLLGMAYQQLEQYDQSLIFLNKAIGVDPDNSFLHHSQAVVLQSLKRLDEAVCSYKRAIQLEPDNSDVYNNLGSALSDLKLFEEAHKVCMQAIQLNPASALAYNNLGIILKGLGRLEEAIASYDRAIELSPNYAIAYNNRGNLLKELNRLEEAIASYDRAIELSPNYAIAYNNRGNLLKELNRLEEAIASYDLAFTLQPEINYLLGNLIHTKMHLCDWRDYNILVNQLISETQEEKETSVPFILLSCAENADHQRQSAETYARENYPVKSNLLNDNSCSKHSKIRIGYFSADFHNHATMYLMAELFECHNKDKFELYGFSFGPKSNSEWRKRVEPSFNQFFDVKNLSDADIAVLAGELEIDIAVDLKGFTQDARTNIFAHKVAPIQISYLGYPGTMGCDYIDYIVADPILIPKDKQKFYSEKVIYLPNSYQANVKDRVISSEAFTRNEVGLPDDAFVFCSFNNNYKITPIIFDGWLRILKAVESSVLWIFNSNDTVTRNLRKEAEARGVSPDRLIFAHYLPIEEHLKRIQLADLFLDTYPYGAHTTASDALRVGLPIVTLMGESFASRVAGSLLSAVGLPSLTATTQADYESLAIELATNPQKLQAVKSKLIKNVEISPLYDPKLFARHIEAAYKAIYERNQQGLGPDHIYV